MSYFKVEIKTTKYVEADDALDAFDVAISELDDMDTSISPASEEEFEDNQ